MTLLTIFDLMLVAILLLLAWRLLASDTIFTAVVLFMSFGLFMALAWVRLAAPDIALAEAAIGAGITGPLFLAAKNRMERGQQHERRLDNEEHRDATSTRES